MATAVTPTGKRGREAKYNLVLENAEGLEVKSETLSAKAFGGGEVSVDSFSVKVTKGVGANALFGNDQESLFAFLSDYATKYAQAGAKVRLNKLALGVLSDIVDSVEKRISVAADDGDDLSQADAISKTVASYRKRGILKADLSSEDISKIADALNAE